MELKKDPYLLGLAGLVVVVVGVLVYKERVSWELGGAFLGLYLMPSIFGRKGGA